MTSLGPPGFRIDCTLAGQSTARSSFHDLALQESFHQMYRLIALALVSSLWTPMNSSRADDATRPNLLIVTVDDMSCDSVGAFGCELDGTTPTIDRLAASGMRYQYAHVQVGNCYPSRNVMFSGRYPHNTGVEGFYAVNDPGYPHLVDLMKQAGYFVGIRGKVSHSTPYQPYGWSSDLTVLDGEKQDLKNADSYFASTRRGIELARSAGQPFCLNINISDPHKPFYATGRRGQVVPDSNIPSRIFSPGEVPVPGFLFEHPDVRTELAQYYSSVRRADDCVAAVLKALTESGQVENTVVFFLSDHGMPLPFAKTALWHHSTRTPWIVRWPGVTEPGSIDDQHMISAVDLLPTLLEIADVPLPKGMDGRSFASTLRGEPQSGRDYVFKVYNENSGGNRSPMRSIQSKRFGYLFNPWSDGKRVFKTATTGTMTFRAMQKVAETDPVIAKRLELFQHGVVEEFYDYQKDPDALVNLIDDPQYADEVKQHREIMFKMMEQTGDHCLEAFKHRNDPQRMSGYVDRVQAESDARRKRKRAGTPAKQNPRLFQLKTPSAVASDGKIIVTINHRLPQNLGTQKFHVTLKGVGGKRIERIVKSAGGAGELEFQFKVPPAALQAGTLTVAAFVGEEYSRNLLHRTSKPIATER